MSSFRERLCAWAIEGDESQLESLLDAVVIDRTAMLDALELLDTLPELAGPAGANAEALELIEQLVLEGLGALPGPQQIQRALELAPLLSGHRGQILLRPFVLDGGQVAEVDFEQAVFNCLFEDAADWGLVHGGLRNDPEALQWTLDLLETLGRLGDGVILSPAARLAADIDALGRLEEGLEQWLDTQSVEAVRRRLETVSLGPRAVMLLAARLTGDALPVEPVVPEVPEQSEQPEVLVAEPWTPDVEAAPLEFKQRRRGVWVAAAAMAAAVVLAFVYFSQPEQTAKPPAPVVAGAPDMGGVADAAPMPLEVPQVTPKLAATANRPAMMRVPKGEFLMGSPEDEAGRGNDEATHKVTISRDYYLAQTEVTQAQWRALMGTEPARFKGLDAHPVESVNWFEAAAYMNALSAAEDLGRCYTMTGCVGQAGTSGFRCEAVEFNGVECEGYRLPTEAEWERAARGGTEAATYAGNLVLLGKRNAPVLDDIAWYSGNSGVEAGGLDCAQFKETQYPARRCGTHPVAEKRANAYGLHDMIGNVWEWTGDRYQAALKAATDPTGPEVGDRRATRGCGWFRIARFCRAANRYRPKSGYRSSVLGFRPARTVR